MPCGQCMKKRAIFELDVGAEWVPFPLDFLWRQIVAQPFLGVFTRLVGGDVCFDVMSCVALLPVVILPPKSPHQDPAFGRVHRSPHDSGARYCVDYAGIGDASAFAHRDYNTRDELLADLAAIEEHRAQG